MEAYTNLWSEVATKESHEELLAEVRALRDIIIKMETWCRILDADLTDMQDKLRRVDG